MLFNDIRRNRKLADRRSPMYDKNRFAKVLIYFSVAFWAAYLVFVGVTLSFAFEEEFGNRNPYDVLNKVLLIFLILDFLIRFLFPTPLQEIKPYLLLPIPKHKVLNALLIQHGLSLFNLFWLFLFVPFACLSVFRFYGVMGIMGYAVGIWLLMVANCYWSMLIKTLMRVNFAWLALVIPVYGILALLEFLPNTHFVSTLTMYMGEGYILWNPLSLLGTLIAGVLLAWVNRRVQERLIYSELSRTEDTRVKHISSYAFLDRYGKVGEYMRLELKMIFRNSIPKKQFWWFIVLMAFFVAMMTAMPDEGNQLMGRDFICLYCYSLLGLVTLVRTMSNEGTYIDGLMVRRESIFALLCAKYYVQCAFLLIPFVLTLVPVIMGSIPLLMSVSYLIFTMGVTFACVMQLAVYNDKTAILNAKFMGKQQGNSAFQTIASLCAFFLPLLISKTLAACFSPTTAYLIMSAVGLLLIATHQLWLRNIYQRFMKRRYTNLEGFRSTR